MAELPVGAYFKRIPFRGVAGRLIKYQVIGILLIIVLSLIAIWGHQVALSPLRHSIQRHELSEKLVRATSCWARERGLTNIAMNASEPVDTDILKEIRREAECGDTAFKEARELFMSHLPRDSMDWARVDMLFKEFKTLREDINGELGREYSARGKSKSQDWVDFVTGLIAAVDDLMPYRTEFSGTDRLEGGRDKLSRFGKVQYGIWKISELAGRERAIIGGVLSYCETVGGDALICDKKLREQKEYLEKGRAEIEDLWKEVKLRLADIDSVDSKGEQEIINDKYFVEFNGYREEIYGLHSNGVAATSESDEWYRKATLAIDSFLGLGEMLGEKASSEASRKAKLEANLVRVIMVIVFVLAGAFTAVCGWGMVHAGRLVKNAKKLIEINITSDDMLECVAGWALERGVLCGASSLLDANNDTAALAGHIDSVRKRRAGLDCKFINALCEVRKQQVAGMEQLIASAEDHYSVVLKIRHEIDEYLRPNMGNIPKKDESGKDNSGKGGIPQHEISERWREAITNLNSSVEELHLVSLHSGLGCAAVRHLQDDNSKESVAVKHMVWVMSEYAGRERALVAGAIPYGKTLRDSQKDEIGELRRRVDSAWSAVQEAIKGSGGEGEQKKWPEVTAKQGVVANIFNQGIIGSGIGTSGGAEANAHAQEGDCAPFVNFRHDILEENGPGEWLEVATWVERATLSIETILALNKAVTTDSANDEEVWRKKFTAAKRMAIFWGALLLVVIAGGVVFWVWSG